MGSQQLLEPGRSEETYNATALDAQACRVISDVTPIKCGGALTFTQFIDEMFGDLLQLCRVNSKELLKVLDFLEQVLRDVGKGAWVRHG